MWATKLSEFRFGLFSRICLAVFAGLISSLAFPRENLSPFIFVSTVLLLLALYNQGILASGLIGFTGGLAFYLSQVEWLSLYLGPIPWLALGTLEALIFMIGSIAITQVWNRLSAFIKPSNRYRLVLISLAIASIWNLREWVSITLPYGGFPWSRLAQTQSDTYLSKWVYIGGISFLTWLIALVAALVAVWLVDLRFTRRRFDAPAFMAAALVFAIPLLMFIPVNNEAGEIKLAAVQGNANAGLFANPKRGSILNNHLEASKELIGKELDVVIWPENASDLSPFSDPLANARITTFVNDELKTPLIFGTITTRGNEMFNSSILWKPGVGPTDFYDKKRPVPFAEYVPDRDFWYSLAPDLVGLVYRGYAFGTRDGIFEIGNHKLGTLICFEIAIDDIGRDLVNEGAQVIISQTNNADFGHSDETYQQAAFARLRAIETGRVVVNDSTVGLSAIFMPDGTVLEQLPTFEAGSMIAALPMTNSRTPAMLIGRYFDLVINSAALLIIAICFVLRRRSNI